MSKSVRAKMKCSEIATRDVSYYDYEKKVKVEATNETVKLTAASGPGNETWSKATPTATMELWITNPDAVKQFVVGAEYYVDFTPAE